MKHLLPILFLVALLANSSCGKYEEGPYVSLRTKKARLCQQWYAHSLVTQDGEVSLLSSGDYLIFKKNGDCEIGSSGNSLSDSGSWDFVDDKEYLEVILASSNGFEYDIHTYQYRIIKLKTNKLVLENQQGQLVEYRTNN